MEKEKEVIKFELIRANTAEEVIEINKRLLESENYSTSNFLIGILGPLEVSEGLNKTTNQKYKQIEFHIATPDKKRYTRKYSVDFSGKFLRQFGLKHADIPGLVAAFTIDPKYKKVRSIYFVMGYKDQLTTRGYIDEGFDFSKELDALNL